MSENVTEVINDPQQATLENQSWGPVEGRIRELFEIKETNKAYRVEGKKYVPDAESRTGKPVEIKSCQKQIKNGVRKETGTTKWTAGRFQIKKHQHAVLVDRDGFYIFAVCQETELLHCRAMPAGRVDGMINGWADVGGGYPDKAQLKWSDVIEVPGDV